MAVSRSLNGIYYQLIIADEYREFKTQCFYVNYNLVVFYSIQGIYSVLMLLRFTMLITSTLSWLIINAEVLKRQCNNIIDVQHIGEINHYLTLQYNATFNFHPCKIEMNKSLMIRYRELKTVQCHATKSG